MRKNKSGFRGVTWSKSMKTWQAQIIVNYVRHHLGYYSNPEEASIAYKAAAEKLHTHRPIDKS